VHPLPCGQIQPGGFRLRFGSSEDPDSENNLPGMDELSVMFEHGLGVYRAATGPNIVTRGAQSPYPADHLNLGVPRPLATYGKSLWRTPNSRGISSMRGRIEAGR